MPSFDAQLENQNNVLQILHLLDQAHYFDNTNENNRVYYRIAMNNWKMLQSNRLHC